MAVIEAARNRGFALTMVALIVFGAVVTMLRLVPEFDADSGVFVSGASVVADGGRLYVDFFDHKDPLFYYVAAAASWLFGPTSLFVLDVVWITTLAALASLIASRLGLGRLEQIAAGAVTVLAATHPAVFFAGMSQLQAMTLLMAAFALVLFDWPLTGGLVAAMAVASKLPVIGLALLFAGLIWLTRRERPDRYLIGLVTGVFLVAGVLVVRGELVGFVEAVRVNLGYLDSVARTSDLGRPPFGSMARLWDLVLAPELRFAVAVYAVATVIAGLQIVRGWRLRPPSWEAAVLATGLASGIYVFLALSTVNEHHLQILGLSAGLVVAAAIASIRPASAAGAVVAALIGIGLVSSSLTGVLGNATWPEFDLASPTALGVNDILAEAGLSGANLSYGVYGGVTEYGMVAFLSDELSLACPDVYQVPAFGERRFSDHLECMRSKADLVVENPALWEEDFRRDAAYDGYAAAQDAHLAELELLGERLVPAGVVRVYWGRTPAINVVWDTDLLATKSRGVVDCCYADIDDHVDLLVVYGGLPRVSAIVLDRGWLSAAPGLDALPPTEPGLATLEAVGAVYEREIPVVSGSPLGFDPQHCAVPPPEIANLRDVLTASAPVAYVTVGSLRQLAWVVCAYPDVQEHIVSALVFAGDASSGAPPEWNAAMDPAALEFVIEETDLDVTWLPIFDGGPFQSGSRSVMFSSALQVVLEPAPDAAEWATFAAWTRTQYGIPREALDESRFREFYSETRALWSSGLVTGIDLQTGRIREVPGVFTFETVAVNVDQDGVIVAGEHPVRRIKIYDQDAYREWAVAAMRHAVSVEP